MRTVGADRLRSFTSEGKLRARKNAEIRRDPPCKVQNYTELATFVANLQYENPDYVLLFRGQNDDYMRDSDGNAKTTLMPSLLRGRSGSNPSRQMLRDGFDELSRAERALVRAYEAENFPNIDELKRQRILRWSILQHYEICPTPLLDVTHSLRIAASFASDHRGREAYLFVLAVPNLSGAITASAEAGLQIVRLASVCPPEAMRPHIQEGYLLGEYPEMGDFDAKENYAHWEVDFGRRLLAKFRFDIAPFWQNSGYFPQVQHNALYPDHNDPLFSLAERVKRRSNLA